MSFHPQQPSILHRAPTSPSLSPSNSISVRMANPSSSCHDHNNRECRHHSDMHSPSSHHHRTISSTTLLLVLLLILAVLVIMLSLPADSAAAAKDDPAAQGVWGYLTSKQSQALRVVAHESVVAACKAEVARHTYLSWLEQNRHLKTWESWPPLTPQRSLKRTQLQVPRATRKAARKGPSNGIHRQCSANHNEYHEHPSFHF